MQSGLSDHNQLVWVCLLMSPKCWLMKFVTPLFSDEPAAAPSLTLPHVKGHGVFAFVWARGSERSFLWWRESQLQTAICDSELLLSLIHVRSAVTHSFPLLMYNNVNSAGLVSSCSLNWVEVSKGELCHHWHFNRSDVLKTFCPQPRERKEKTGIREVSLKKWLKLINWWSNQTTDHISFKTFTMRTVDEERGRTEERVQSEAHQVLLWSGAVELTKTWNYLQSCLMSRKHIRSRLNNFTHYTLIILYRLILRGNCLFWNIVCFLWCAGDVVCGPESEWTW